MQTPEVEPIENIYKFQSRVNILNVQAKLYELTVTLASGGDKTIAEVRFRGVLGFRLLDEGNLLEFWPTCSADNGWLFLIKKNGWFDLESTRSGFLLTREYGLSEYFVASMNSCLNVLAEEPPIVEVFPI